MSTTVRVSEGHPGPDSVDPPLSALRNTLARGPVRAAGAILGPAFVASIAYVDPGNFATNFAAGSRYGYRLVWVVVMASLMAMLIQYVTAKVGIVTQRNLPELCARRYSRRTNLALWVQAEAVVMATDLAEFVGAALGMHLVFGVPLLPAGLITAVVSFAILALQRRGYRRFELVIIAMLGLLAAGIGYLLVSAGHESPTGIAHGLIPHLGGADAVGLAVGIIGATVMPHAIYLHSALHPGRIRPVDTAEKKILLRYNRWDCIVGLGLAGVVNLAMLCIAASVFHLPGLSGITDLIAIHDHLGTLVGGGAALAFGIALMTSGLSSASVGTYAGQVVMAGFTGWRIPLPLRRAITMLPALIVLAVSADTGQALLWSQIALSFGIPFALVPLTLLGQDRALMGDLVNRRITSGAMWVLTTIIASLNLYLIIAAVR